MSSDRDQSGPARILSGIQATGVPHIGNYLGAIRRWASVAGPSSFYMIADLHAITVPRRPAELMESRFSTAASLFAAGLDKSGATVFFQSDVPEHTEFAWLLGSVASMGELGRMTQFKSKAAKADSASLDLFAYPVLQAADILLYQASEVPVGEDQVQHVELTRNLANRFNGRFGPILRVPRATLTQSGARIMDLQDPIAKMSKSSPRQQGVILMTDTADQIRKKFRRAVTDAHPEVGDPSRHGPGVANLISIIAAAEDVDPEMVWSRFQGHRYGGLKDAAADSVVELVTPIGSEIARILDCPSEMFRRLAEHASRASAVAGATLAEARAAMGLGPLDSESSEVDARGSARAAPPVGEQLP